MKRIRLSLLTSLLAISGSVFGYSAGDTFTSGGLKYQLENSSKVKVVGYSSISDWSNVVVPATVVGPSDNVTYTIDYLASSAFGGNTSIKGITFQGVIRVGASAFKECTALKTVTFKAVSGSEIDYWAFQSCTALTTVNNIPWVTKIGNYAFDGCTALAGDITLDQCKTVGAYAFQNCSKITSVSFYSGYHPTGALTSLGVAAFKGCTSLGSVCFPSTCSTIPKQAFKDCTELNHFEVIYKFPTDMSDKQNALTTIGDEAFMNCTKFDIATADYSVYPTKWYRPIWDGFTYCPKLKTIGNSAFKNCTQGFVNGMKFPESIRTVGTSAFMNCQNMGRALFNDATALTSLGDSVFYGCTRMTICTFSDDESGDYTNFKVIPNAAFQACTSLNTVVLASTLNEVGQSAFRYCTSLRVCDFSNTTVSKIGDYAFENCDLSGYTLNSPAIQTIGNYAFFNTNIVKITDCHLLQSIGSTAFTNCTKLTTFDLDPADHRLNHIGSSAFAKCTSLQDFTFPHNITDIQEAAFMYCTSLTKVVFDRDEGATPQITTFSKNCFAYCTSLKSIEIPENVTTIVSGAFEFTPALEKFDCKASKFTTDAHSALMSSDKTVFVHYPSMSKSMISGNEGPVENYTGYVVPETVTSMHEGAFTDAAYLTKIVLPSKLTYVPRDCFAGTKALKEVTIPAAVTEIRQGIFAEGAEALTDLYITGDPSKITILYPSTQFIRTSAAASKRTLHVKPKYLAAWQDHDYADNFGTVTSNVTIKIPSSGYATICRDYDIDLQSVSGTAKIYALTGFNTQTGEFTLTQVTQVTTPSGGKTTRTYISSRTDANNATYTPLIITGNKNSTITAKMGDYDYGESTFYKTVVSNNTLGAALVDTHTPYANRNMYFLVLKNGDFHFLKESGVIPYGKAYAMLSHSSAGNWYSNAKSKDEGLSLVFVDADDSETTGISTVDNGQLSIDNAAWYTLDGVKLNAEPTQKGLYIKNGKKIVIK